MIEHEEKLTIYSPIKIKVTTISDKINFEDLASITGSFSLSMVKNSGEAEQLPEVTGSLLNVLDSVNNFDANNYKVAVIVQTRTIND